MNGGGYNLGTVELCVVLYRDINENFTIDGGLIGSGQAENFLTLNSSNLDYYTVGLKSFDIPCEENMAFMMADLGTLITTASVIV